MTTEANNTTERKALDSLAKYAAQQILRMESIIKNSTETLARDFNGNFEWEAEHIFKANLRLEFLVELNKLLCDEECNEEAVKFYLRQTVKRKRDDIMNCDPYSRSSNGASDLADRWRYEADKDIMYLARNTMDRFED